ncbi:MAG: hypothetical protein HY011_05985 [Acidobacteria bacterium]|nr:hypothetical protein [Acidobacteriota bacterium]
MQLSKKLFLNLCLSLLVVGVLSVIGSARANFADLTGTWKLTLQTQQGTSNPTLTLKQEGEELTGTYKGRLGEAPVKGTVKGNAFKFSLKVNAQGNELQIDYDGTLEADGTIKGKAKFGDFGEGTFTGKKE